jgi:hypothetical protein
MKRCIFFYKILLMQLLFLVIVFNADAQVYINELDSDSPGIDDKEIIEIRTIAPYSSLNGHVVVLFNGNAASSTAFLSYYAISLDGQTTDTNGIFTIGSAALSPAPDLVIPDNIIQNGEDALAIYTGTMADFPVGTLATTTNLVHALAYDTGDPDAVALMTLLGITAPQMDENENGAQATESIQRKNNGSFEVKLPTPGAMNDGTGFIYNGLQIYANTANRTEGDTLHITIKTQFNVSTNTNFNIGLSKGNFTTADYTGNIAVNFPAGTNTFNTIITLVDDVLDEGDEVLKIKFGALPFGFNRLNDNIEIRVVDNDYKVDPWGTPLNPTYGIVQSTAPSAYYSTLNGLAGNDLFLELQKIISDTNTVRAHNYGDAEAILKEADHNPKNGNQVWLMYVERPMAKLDYQTSSSGVGKWNREHIYPQSRGGFANGTDEIPDGINIYLPTGPNDILAGHADAHHLRAEDATENSTRNNKDYCPGDYLGPINTANSWRGDVSRALFYMAVRYKGLQVVSGNPADTTNGKMGDLDSLLVWNKTDARDDFEMYRNNYIFDNWQKNRNPFIDLPDLADYIWGSKAGDTWFNPTSLPTIGKNTWSVYPNPAHGSFTIDGVKGKAKLLLYDVCGKLLLEKEFENRVIVKEKMPNGIYYVKIMTSNYFFGKKIIIN